MVRRAAGTGFESRPNPGAPREGLAAHACARNSAISVTLYSMPFRPPPTTNHPSPACTRRIPTVSSAANQVASGRTHRPAAGARVPASSIRVMPHATAVPNGRWLAERNSPKPATPPVPDPAPLTRPGRGLY